MKVAIKFCGGCDPAYDRVSFFDRIRSVAGDRIRWVRPGEDEHEATLLICGCPRACPEQELPAVGHLITLKTDQPPPERVVTQLLEKGDTDADQDQG